MRKIAFSRNILLQNHLEFLNSTLKSVDLDLVINNSDNLPIIFIMGSARSGTTLALQLFSLSKSIAYPSNFTSRFYKAPLIGALIDKIMFDDTLDFKSETSIERGTDFSSNLGKTKGLLEPNEYWFLWKYLLFGDDFLDKEIDDISRIPMTKLEQKNVKETISSLPLIYQKPYLFKGNLFNYVIPKIQSIFENSIFVYVKRDTASNVASLKRAREKYFDNSKLWYSFKIPEYHFLKNISNIDKQITGQVYYNNQAIQNGLKKIDKSKKMTVDYDDLCKNPDQYFENLRELIHDSYNFDIGGYTGPNNFKNSKITDHDYREKIHNYLEYFKGLNHEQS